MESKFDRNESDTQSADRAQARDAVEVMVEREEARSRSRMLAYGIVGRRVRRSASWVRRFLAGVDVGFAHETFCLIRTAYVAHCDHLARDAALARRRAAAMNAEADAIERDFRPPQGRAL